ncbi:MAG TPA: hypothetical protein VFE24_16855 [Pirellulales bacterium]|nr:hypothetical protein [Pirellulales bacterium]
MKNISLFAVAIILTGSFAFAGDDLAGIDVKSITDANDAVIEASVNVDVDALAAKTQKEDAVEACFHRCGYYGGCGYSCYNPCYSYCYSPCYSSCYNSCYSYNTCSSYTCYEPTYYVAYRPVTYTTYSTCYSPCYSSWGCGCSCAY